MGKTDPDSKMPEEFKIKTPLRIYREGFYHSE